MGRGAFGKIERKEDDIMAWKEPKTDWQAADVPTAFDFDRIEGNIQYLKELLG